jgi:hypothetical protein
VTRRVLGACSAALLVAAASAQGLTPVPRPCSTSDLRLRYSGSEGAAGTQVEKLRFVARRGVTCALKGYPAVALQGRSGDELRIRLRRAPGTPQRVVLTSGEPARFTIRHPTISPRTGRPCAIRVFSFGASPPGDSRAVTVGTGRRAEPPFCRTRARVTPLADRYER